MACKKKKFTRSRADRVVLNAKIARSLRGNVRRRETRSYLCPECNAWHVTSRE